MISPREQNETRLLQPMPPIIDKKEEPKRLGPSPSQPVLLKPLDLQKSNYGTKSPLVMDQTDNIPQMESQRSTYNQAGVYSKPSMMIKKKK